MPDTDECNLLAAAVGGSLDALSTLLERLGPDLRRELSIAAKWQALIDADDIMQSTYIEAYLRIRQFDGSDPKRFRGWLRTIAQNNLRDAIRGLERDKRPPPDKRLANVNSAQSYVALYDIVGATSRTPSRSAAEHEIRTVIDRALDELPPDYAQVIRLFELQGLSGPEVAQAMKRSRGAVFMLLARAHDRLSEVLGSDSQFFSHGA